MISFEFREYTYLLASGNPEIVPFLVENYLCGYHKKTLDILITRMYYTLNNTVVL